MSAIVAESYERSVITNKSHPYKIVSVYVLYTVDIVDILDVVDYMLYILCNYENTLHMLHIALQPATYGTKVNQSGTLQHLLPKLLVAMVSHIGIPSQFYVGHQAP